MFAVTAELQRASLPMSIAWKELERMSIRTSEKNSVWRAKTGTGLRYVYV